MFEKKCKLRSSLLELTLKCNMRCRHCGSSAGNVRENELSTSEWLGVIDQLSNLGCEDVIFTGGEPILRNDWFDIAQRVRAYDMNFSLLSNGLLINRENVAKLRSLNPHTVAISIDGANAQTHDSIRGIDGSFKRCIDSLNYLNIAGVPASVVTTANKLNISELPQMRDLLLNRNVAWQIQIGNPMGRFPREIALSEEEFYAVAMFIASTRKEYSYKEIPITGAHCIGYHSTVLPSITLSPWTGCDAGVNVLSIQSNGGIKGCLSLPDDYIEGNVRKDQLAQIWNNKGSFDYNRQFEKCNLGDDCFYCRHAKNCMGGCMSTSISFSGKPHGDPYCLYNLERQMSAT